MYRLTPRSALVTWMDSLPSDTLEVDLTRPLLLTTENSTWLVTDSHYLRTPRASSQRPVSNPPAIEGRLDDHQWHELRAALWDHRPGWSRLNIKPLAGPSDGFGIVTGAILQAGYVDFDDDADQSMGCERRRPGRSGNMFSKKHAISA